MDTDSSTAVIRSELPGGDEEVGVICEGAVTIETLSEAEALQVLTEITVAMLAIGPECLPAFGAIGPAVSARPCT